MMNLGPLVDSGEAFEEEAILSHGVHQSGQSEEGAHQSCGHARQGAH